MVIFFSLIGKSLMGGRGGAHSTSRSIDSENKSNLSQLKKDAHSKGNLLSLESLSPTNLRETQFDMTVKRQ